ncbi:MAG: acyl--CoA ligase [Bacilli bacterium]|nr:acyl--CoA ligase [Bacilli bacterium]
MIPNSLTLFEVLTRYAEEEPDREIFADEQRRYTVFETLQASLGIASFLAGKNVRKHDLVFLRATRSIDTALLFIGLTFLGAATALCDPHQGVKEFADANGMLEKAKFLLTNEDASMDISAVGNFKLIHVASGKEWDCLIPDGKTKAPMDFTPCFNIYSSCAIIFTSGSSDKAKPVSLSLYNLMNHCQNFAEAGSGTREDNCLMLLPIHHVFGLAEILMVIWMRCRLYFAPSLEFETTMHAIQQEKITRLDSIPAYLMALAKLKELKKVDLPSLNASLVGGTNLIEEELVYLEDTLGITICPVYGQSECIAISGINAAGSRKERLGTVGRFLPMCDGKLIDADGKEVEAGDEGEIIVKAPSVMMGYYGDIAATSAAIDSNGYLHTGDLGCFDENGCLHIVGRKKEIIIRNGINLSPASIEAKILKTGFFEEVAVVGIEDRLRGEVPAVAVVYKESVLSKLRLGEKEALKIVEDALLKIEYPAVTRILKSFPRLASGKVDKIALRKMLIE